MKRNMNRIFLRLAMLALAVILGAIAVVQAQKGLNASETAAIAPNGAAMTQQAQPIMDQAQSITPPQNFSDPNVYGQPAPPAATGYEAAANPSATEQAYVVNKNPSDAGYTDTTYSDAAYTEPAFTDQTSYSDQSTYTDQSYAEQPGASDTAYEQPSSYEPSAYESSEDNYLQPPTQELAQAPTDYVDSTDSLIQPVDNEEDISLAPASEPADSLVQPPLDSGYTDLPPIEDLPAQAPEQNRMSDPAPAVDLEYATQNTPQFDADPGYEQSVATPPPSNDYGQPQQGYSGGASMQFTPTPQPPAATYNEPAPLNTQGTPLVDGANGNGTPGPAEMEGPQTPSLTVTKQAPREIQVGKPARFQVTVRNNGSIDARDVIIRDEVPHGTQLIQSSPSASQVGNAVVWEMGTIRSGSEVTAIMEVMPLKEGDIGSVATVSFQAAVSAKSLSTRPQLTLEHTGPGQVLVGNDVVFHIKLSNPGTGVATNVRLEEDVPTGLRHIDGHELEYHVGTIQPGETRLLELTLKADKPGLVDNLLIARADSDLVAKDNCQLNVVAPALQVGIDGPSRRYLERRAKYQIQVGNPGTASARNIELVARLPKGLQFVSTNNAGQYNSQDHSVYWSLAELPSGEMGMVEVVALPTSMGEQRIRIESNAAMGLSDSADHSLMVDGLAALLFTVEDEVDPIEIDGQTSYAIRVVNQGSKTATNLRLMALLPAGMQAINGEGPSQATINGQQVFFEPLPRLAPQSDTMYKIHVKGVQPGDMRIQVQLMSDEVSQPVTKEESTHVYSDE